MFSMPTRSWPDWRRWSQVLAMSGAAIGAVVFFAWILGIEVLKRIHPEWVTMKPNTALCIILSGAAIALCGRGGESWRRRTAQACAVIVGGVGVYTLGTHLGWFPPVLDLALFRESLESAGRSFPGRMNPVSALNFILIAAAILCLDVRTRHGWAPTEFCAIAVIAGTGLIFLGYFYGVEWPPPLAIYISIALHTVVAFLLLAASLFLARPGRGLMTVVLADNLGGAISRRLLPAVLLLPAFIGWLAVLGRNAGFYGRGAGIALVAGAFTAIFSSMLVWAAWALARADARRRGAEGARAQLAAIVDSSEDAIISKNLDGIVMSWNASAERLLGYSAAEMIEQPILRIIPQERRSEEREILTRLRAGQVVASYETVRQRKDGTFIDVSLTISPVRNHEGVIVGASKILRDITQRKRDAENLRLARDAAEAANRAKDDFLAVLSHELRTPLTPALAVASELENAPSVSPEALRESMAIIRRNIELEARLVDDLLDTTRIGRCKLHLNTSVVDLHATVRDALAIADPALRNKEIALRLDLAAGNPFVRADPARLVQVFSNLLNNATKFTARGGEVTVRSEVNGSSVRLTVRDNGCGLAPEDLPHIFGPFRQGKTSGARLGGLGLGLSVAKGLVEAHGGTLRAESAGRDQGATFTVDLPLRPGESGAPPLEPASGESTPLRSLRVLLVEDHDDTRETLVRLLTRAGHRVVATCTVAESRTAMESDDFDVLLSDLGLPDGSGLDVISALRAKSNSPAVVMSGYGMEADVARTREAGFTEHLVKPIAAEALRDLFVRLAAPNAPQDHPAPRP